MAINQKETVNFTLTQGEVKVVLNDFASKLQKAMEKEFASLPGVTSTIKPNVKVDPRFDASKALDKLEKQLGSKKMKLQLGEEGIRQATAELETYRKAIASLKDVKVRGLSDQEINNVSKLITALDNGKKKFADFTSQQQKDIANYRNYLEELNKVWKQVGNQFTKINTKSVDPVLSTAKKEADQVLNAAKAEVKRLEALQAQYVASKRDVAPIQREIVSASDKVKAAKENQRIANQTLKDSTQQVGAIVNPAIGSLFSNIKQTIKRIDSGLTQVVREQEGRSKVEAKLRNDAISREASIANKAFVKDAATRLANENLTTFAKDSKLESLTHSQLKELKRLAGRERSALESQYNDLGKPFVGVDRHTQLLAIENQIVDELKHRAKLLQEANRLQAEANKQQRAMSPAVVRGLQVRRQYPDAQKTPQEGLNDRKAAARYLLGEASNRLDSLTNAKINAHPGMDTAKLERDLARASRAVYGFRDEIHQLNAKAAHTHPVIERFSNLLNRFAQYGIGYAALYKVTQGFNELVGAVTNFEDKLKTIQAVTGATNSDMITLSSSIKKVSQTTGFDIGEITDAVRVIAQAGVALSDLPKTTSAVVNLATASGTTLNAAADVITTAKAVWDDVDVTTIADRITQASNVSKLAVEDLQTILSLEASSAKANNLSLDQTLSMIAVLRNKGIKPSTIATGMRQMTKELFSPDKKFTDFLVQQYSGIGENVSSEDARRRFANFRNTDAPVLRALQELVRIGTNGSEAQVRLARAVDERALNPLRALLPSVNDIPATEAKLISAPTSAEAAKVAMDSVKKAAGNLGDASKELADTILRGGGLLEATKSLLRATTDLFHFIDENVKAARSEGSAPVKDGFLTAAGRFVTSKLSGNSIGKSAVDAATAGGVVTTGELSDNKIVATAAEVGGDAVQAMGVLGLLKWLWKEAKSKLPAAAAGAEAGAAGAEAGAAGAEAGAAATSLLSRAALTAVAVGVGEFIAIGFVTYLGKLGWDKWFGEGKNKDLPRPTADQILERFSDQTAKNAEETNQVEKYLPYQAGTEPNRDTLAGNQVFIDRQTKSLMDKFPRANQKEVIAAIDEHVRLYRDESVNQEKGKIALEALNERFGTKFSNKDLSELSGTVTGIESGKQGQLRQIQDLNNRLSSQKPETGTFEAEQKAYLENETAKGNNVLRNILRGLSESNTPEQNDAEARKFTKAMGDLAAKRVDRDRLTYSKIITLAEEASTAEGAESERLIAELINTVKTQVKASSNPQEWQYIKALLKQSNTAPSVRKVVGQALSAAIDEKTGADQAALDQTTEQLAFSAKTINQAKDATPADKEKARQIDETLKKQNMSKELRDRIKRIKTGPYHDIIVEEANKIGLDTNLALAFAEAETSSGYNVRDSSTGAKGVMQVMPAAARDISKVVPGLPVDKIRSNAPEDQRYNIRAGLNYLKLDIVDQYNKEGKATVENFAIGYNAGPNKLNNLKKQGLDKRSLPQETKNYAKLVPSIYDALNGNFGKSPLEESGLVTRNKDNTIGKSAESTEFVNKAANYQPTIEPLEVKEFDPSSRFQDNLQQIRNLERDISDMREKGKRDDLGKSGPENPINKKLLLVLQNLDEKIAHESAQPYDKPEKKNRIIKQLQDDKAEARSDALNEVEKNFREGRVAGLDVDLKTINAKLSEAVFQRDQAAGVGLVDLMNQKNQEILDLLEARKKIQIEQNYYAKAGVERERGKSEAISEAAAAVQAQKSVDTFIGAQRAKTDRLNRLDPVLASKTLAGTAFSKEEEQTRLGSTLRNQNDQLAALIFENGRTPGAIGGTKFEDEIKRLKSEIASTEQGLKDLNANLATEAEEIKATSIASKIRDLPDAMKNFNRNFEARVVGYADSVAGILSAATINVAGKLLGFGQSLEEFQQRLSLQSDVWDAEGGMADVKMQGIDIAERIAAIRQNETDPARQEYLISQAMQGQQTQQAIAQNRINAAQQAVDQYDNENSVFAALGNATTDLLGGVANDALKSTLLEGFSSLFDIGGKYGESKDKALWVRFAEASEEVGKTALNPLKRGWEAVTGFLGFGEPEKKDGADVATAVEDGLTTGLDGSGLNTLGDQISDTNTSFLSEMGTLFSGFTGKLGAVMGLSKLWQADTLDMVKQGLGIASSVVGMFGGGGGASSGASSMSAGGIDFSSFSSMMGRASGGYITGPGTSTSDSIPTLLSNGEYVINAAAVKAIGKGALDRLNDFHRSPMRFSTGGLVSQQTLRQAVTNSAPASPVVNVAPSAPQEVSIRNIIVDDHRNVGDFMTSAAGERIIMSTLRRNQAGVKAMTR